MSAVPRSAALAAPLLLLSGLVTACGSGSAPATGDLGLDFSERLDAVSVEGAEGEDPTITWNERMEAAGIEAETLVEGEGEALEDGDSVLVNFVLANGYTRTTLVDTFGPDAAGAQFEVGGEPATPQSFGDVVAGFIGAQLEPGVTRGTRLAITGDATAIFGDSVFAQAVAAEGVGNKDGMLVVADVLDVMPLEAPDGTQQEAQPWAPTLQFGDGGVPTGFDLADVEPGEESRKAVLKEGTGDAVEKGDLVVLDFLAQATEGTEPLDSTFAPDREPLATSIGLNAAPVKAWDRLLLDVPVGSRVLLEVPAAQGFRTTVAAPEVPPGSTLYFLVDVLAAV